MSDQVKYSQKLKGKKVLITGGTSGIGFCIAEASLEAGASVIVASSKQEKVDKTIAKLQQSYPSAKDKVSGHVCDLASEDTLEDNVKALLEKTGKLDHIVHTAGDTLPDLPLAMATLPEIKRVGMVRFFAPMIIGKYAKQYLNDSYESSFTITTGSTIDRPLPGWTVITSYGAGLVGMTKSLALELAPVRVNLVAPGAVQTELWDHMGEKKKQELIDSFSAKSLTKTVPGPEQVAEAYLYLMRDYNITGSTISTNSGAILL